jgi:hypothetical protein
MMACAAGAEPLYATWTASTPVIWRKCSNANRMAEVVPVEAKFSLPGFALA